MQYRRLTHRLLHLMPTLGLLAVSMSLAGCDGDNGAANSTTTAKASSSDVKIRAGGVGAGPGLTGIFHDRLAPGETLTAIALCAGIYVDSIQLITDRGAHAKQGGPGGTCLPPFALAAGEKIVKVFGSGNAIIDSLGFVTSSGRTIGPVGGNGGFPFSMAIAPGEQFHGLSGSDGTFNTYRVLAQINLLGDLTGGNGGTVFTDRLNADEKVQSVVICYDPVGYVRSVQLKTNANTRPAHGYSPAGLPCDTTALQDNEYITEIFGNADQYVNKLGYATNLGRRVGPFGGPGGTGFNQTVIGDNRFAGWTGRSGGWLDKIGLITQPAGDNNPNATRIEPKTNPFIDQLPSGEVITGIDVCAAVISTADYTATVVQSLRATLGSNRKLPLDGGAENASTQKPCAHIDFAPGEFITEMFGKSGGVIDSVNFRTNTGREFGPFGGAGGGTPYLLRNPSTSEFLGFAGRYVYGGVVTNLDFATRQSFEPTPVPGPAAAVDGWWSDLVDWPINAIHASVLGDGRVLTYGTNASGAQGAQFIYDVWTPSLGAANPQSHLTLDNTTGTDLFCSAQTLRPDGTVLLAGGDNRINGGYNDGVVDVNFFDPISNALKKLTGTGASDTLRAPRWYASQTMLPSGRILVTGGRDKGADNSFSSTPEIYTPGIGWKALTALTGSVDFATVFSNYYPRVFVGPRAGATGDRVYIVPTTSNTIYRLDIDANGGALLQSTNVKLPQVMVGNATVQGTHSWERAATMITPDQALLQLDSGDTAIVQFPTAVNNVTPMTRLVGRLSQIRQWANFVVLPTGDVVASGGAAGSKDGDPLEGFITATEIWNPIDGLWHRGAAELRPRLYHSTAVLLHNGQVLSTGGGSPGPVLNLNAQLYSPPYFFQPGGTGNLADRPAIVNAAATMPDGGAPFTIETPQPGAVRRVTLTRLNSTTHAFDFDARLIELAIVQRTGNAVVVAGPSDHFAAPPGQYLLTIINTNRVPSISRTVTLY